MLVHSALANVNKYNFGFKKKLLVNVKINITLINAIEKCIFAK